MPTNRYIMFVYICATCNFLHFLTRLQPSAVLYSYPSYTKDIGDVSAKIVCTDTKLYFNFCFCFLTNFNLKHDSAKFGDDFSSPLYSMILVSLVATYMILPERERNKSNQIQGEFTITSGHWTI